MNEQERGSIIGKDAQRRHYLSGRPAEWEPYLPDFSAVRSGGSEMSLLGGRRESVEVWSRYLVFISPLAGRTSQPVMAGEPFLLVFIFNKNLQITISYVVSVV